MAWGSPLQANFHIGNARSANFSTAWLGESGLGLLTGSIGCRDMVSSIMVAASRLYSLL